MYLKPLVIFLIGFVNTIDEGNVTIIPVDCPWISFVDTSTTSNDKAKIFVTYIIHQEL